ncbi:hypothetical protein GGR50DRAFT_219995 [Xylaria sp. CBS 124048]|nr:hypothetical protein GGR50DRAFT_219995 [Xylaria sp. CBS 124048]
MVLDVPPGTPDRGPGVVLLATVLLVLVIFASLARIASKFVMRQNWWYDDLFAILALPIQVSLLSIVLAWRQFGLGLHTADVVAVNPEYAIKGAKFLYIAIFFFDSSISLPKLSALFFYARVFRSNNKRFTMNLWIVGFIVSGWLVAAIISTIFQCTPIAKAWNPFLPGTCIDTSSWYLATAALSVVVDFYILLLPVPEIWALKIKVSRRIWLLSAFFLAYSVIVISIGRLISTIRLIPTLADDLSWNFPRYLYWACLEGSISLISISVPNTLGLIKAIIGWGRPVPLTKGTEGGKSPGPGHSTGMQGSSDREGFERLVSSEETFALERMDGGNRRSMMMGNRNFVPMDKIHVETQISVSSETHLQHQYGQAV